MDKTFFIGKWTAVDFILVDMSLAGRILDENGKLNEDFKAFLSEFYVDIKADNTFELQENSLHTGKWIELESGLGLIPDLDYEKMKKDGFSDEDIAMPFVQDGDKILGDLGPYKIVFADKK